MVTRKSTSKSAAKKTRSKVSARRSAKVAAKKATKIAVKKAAPKKTSVRKASPPTKTALRPVANRRASTPKSASGRQPSPSFGLATDTRSRFASPDLSRLLITPQGRSGTAGIEATGVVDWLQSSLVRTVQPAPPVTTTMLPTGLSPVTAGPLDRLTVIPTDLGAAMDPRLQLAVLNRRSGKRGVALASTQSNEVAVVARVRSVEQWRALPDVNMGSILGPANDGWIVTGRIPVQSIQAVHSADGVLSLKASQPIRPNLAATIAAMHVAPTALPSGVKAAGGKGVIVGVVDFGCDFAHQNFRLASGATRLVEIWHQSGVAKTNSPLGYGRVYDKSEIDAALAAPDPYLALGYGPEPDSYYQTGTHGTHVMDIAAGNGLGTQQPGVAPEADLIFVEASTSDIPWQGPETTTKSFGDSVQLLEAVRHIFDVAGDRPCVCNLSLGTNGGPHDGTSLVEQGLDAIVDEKPNRAIVIAASNSQLDGIHTSGQVVVDAHYDIGWRHVGAGGGEMDVWYPGDRRLRVTLLAPDKTPFGPVEPGNTLPVGAGGQVAIFISSRLNDPNNRDNVIGIWLAANLGDGDWTVRLECADGEPVDFHAWIERDDSAQSSFATPVPTHTLGSISTGHKTIVVGSYDAHKPQFPLSSFSSSGPTRDDRQKPEVSAPGENVLAARSRTLNGVVRKSGTSMAAPAVTGLVALAFAEARRRGKDLAIDDLRTKLATTTLRSPPAGTAWDLCYGVGRADGAAVK